jgi:predicted nucleotidyltransferase
MKTKNINIKNTIKEYFFNNPSEKLRVRQVERKLKLPLPSVIRYVSELVEERILKSEVISNIRLFSADASSKKFLIEKKLHNIKLIYDSGLIDYLVEEYSSPPVIVFGSYSRGEDIESSDIDLYIETPSSKKPNLEKFEKLLHREIQVFIHKKIGEIANKELVNNIINGVNLNGFLEIYNGK